MLSYGNENRSKMRSRGNDGMFFRKMTTDEKANTDKAIRSFLFFLIALGGSSIYSYLNKAELNISFMILMSGLVVFFVSDFLFGKFSKKQFPS